MKKRGATAKGFRIVIVLLIAPFLMGYFLVNLVLTEKPIGAVLYPGASIARSFSHNPAYTSKTETISITITALDVINGYFIREEIPSIFTVVNKGGGRQDTTSTDSSCISNNCLSWSAADGVTNMITKTYTISVPATASGAYQFTGWVTAVKIDDPFTAVNEGIIYANEEPSPIDTFTTTPCTPSTELCDKKDNDCDYLIDKDSFGNSLSQSCSVRFLGQCAIGTETCTAGDWAGCPNPATETCGNGDENCDGATDENPTTLCTYGTNACSPTASTTVDGCDCQTGICACTSKLADALTAKGNCDCKLEGGEVSQYIVGWTSRLVSTFDLSDAIIAWAMNSNMCI